MMCSSTTIFTTAAFITGMFIGQIEAYDVFRCYEAQDNGQPTSPEHTAGHVFVLELILSDGTLFNLVQVDRRSLEKS